MDNWDILLRKKDENATIILDTAFLHFGVESCNFYVFLAYFGMHFNIFKRILLSKQLLVKLQLLIIIVRFRYLVYLNATDKLKSFLYCIEQPFQP